MFSRMAQEILSLYGEKKEYADDIVKNMLMLRALREKASEGSLQFYGSQYKKKGFPNFALKTVGELRNAGLSPEKFRELILKGDSFPEMLEKKLNGDREFSGYEIERLCRILCIAETKERNQIFFAPNVEKTPTNYCIL